MHRAVRSTVLLLLGAVLALTGLAAPAEAATAPTDPAVTPYVVAPDPGGNYTPLALPGGWTGYDSNQTLSVQLSPAGTFAWGDVIQQSVLARITGPVTATGAIYKNGKKLCNYSKVGVAANYSFHGSCAGFAKTDLIIFNLTYTFTCVTPSTPCSIYVAKAFNVV